MEVRPLTERTGMIDLYDEQGSFVGKANVGARIMLADGFYAPERACRNLDVRGDRGFECSACGYEAETYGDSLCNPDDFEFCPMCGAKVVVE